LARRRDAVDAALLAARVQARFEVLYSQRPRFAQRALRLNLEHNLLPGLALYQVLREEHREPQAALAEWDEVVGAPESSPSQRGLKLLGRLPESFELFRAAGRAMLVYGFPSEGWDYAWVEDSDRRLAFTITRCVYLRVLAAYGAPELTEHFCRLDDLMAEALPPWIEWSRTMTLGRGGAACDFCWTHVTAAERRVGARPMNWEYIC
jgi:hypothetical protein